NQRGYGTRPLFACMITWSTFVLLNGLMQLSVINNAINALNGSLPMNYWSETVSRVSLWDGLLLLLGFPILAVLARRGDMKLIGGCLPHAEQGYALLEVNLVASLTTIRSKRFGDAFYDWTKRKRQRTDNADGLAQLPPRPPQIDLLPPEPELVYDTPASGPNYEQSSKHVNQTSSSPKETPSSTPAVNPPPYDPPPVQAKSTRPQQSPWDDPNYEGNGGIGGGCG
ncbi:hypothetical protein FRC00_009812, partial [Tulasnella sp. 408]